MKKRRDKQRAAAAREKYSKNRCKELQHRVKMLQKKAKVEALQQLNAEKKKSKQLDVENSELRREKVLQEGRHKLEVEHLNQLVENNSAIGRELRSVTKENKQLQQQLKQAQSVAEQKAKEKRLGELVLEYFHNNPTASIEVVTGNRKIKQYYPAISATKTVVGKRQTKRRRQAIDNFLGERAKKTQNLTALAGGRLGKEIVTYFPTVAPTSAEQLLALWTHKNLSLDQVKACKLVGWDAGTIE